MVKPSTQSRINGILISAELHDSYKAIRKGKGLFVKCLESGKDYELYAYHLSYLDRMFTAGLSIV